MLRLNSRPQKNGCERWGKRIKRCNGAGNVGVGESRVLANGSEHDPQIEEAGYAKFKHGFKVLRICITIARC